MRRIDAIGRIVACAGHSDLIVATLGFPARELYAAGDRHGNFYMLGSMGLASSLGLGLALCTRQRVYVIDGDGSVLMNAGSLATIAHHAPDNYRLIILDNRSYGSTGGQPTYTAGKTDLGALAAAAGNRHVARVKTANGLTRALKRFSKTAAIIIVEVEPGNADVPVIPCAPDDIRSRFMQAVRHAPVIRS